MRIEYSRWDGGQLYEFKGAPRSLDPICNPLHSSPRQSRRCIDPLHCSAVLASHLPITNARNVIKARTNLIQPDPATQSGTAYIIRSGEGPMNLARTRSIAPGLGILGLESSRTW